MSCCGNDTLVTAGQGITVSGSGTPTDPYIVSVESTKVVFRAQDSATVDFTLIGSGTEADPYIISATASMRLQNLSDVYDPSGPAVGDVPVFDGTNWYFAPPPTVPPGAVNTTDGIAGDGSAPDPIHIAVSDTMTTSTSGLATYIDSNGELRVVPPAPQTVTWSDVTGKPTTFPPTIGGTATTAKAGDWYPTWAQVDNGLTISQNQPVGTPNGHIWLKLP